MAAERSDSISEHKRANLNFSEPISRTRVLGLSPRWPRVTLASRA